MVPQTLATGATPGQYNAAAQELQQCVRDLQKQIAPYQGLLDGVVKLDNVSTWYGQYPSEVSDQISGWLESLNSGTNSLLACIRSWQQLASQYEHQAASAQQGAKATAAVQHR